MNVITINVGDRVDRFILGRRGENEATEVVFDVSQLIATYGEGTAQLAAKLPNSSTPYPVSITQDGNTVTWIVTNADTQTVGNGACELFWYVGDTLAKSVVWTTVILKDIGDVGDTPPDPYETWLETLTELAATTTANARDAAESAGDAEDAQTAAEAAQAAAETAQGLAEDARDSAGQYASNAAQSEDDAAASATLAESWAVGGTDTRSGEDTNNAKFYSEVAQQGAEESGYAWFDVRENDGEMYVTVTANLAETTSFAVNENLGILEVVVNG